MHTMEFQKCWKTVADWIIIQIFNVADIPNKKNSIFFQNFFQFFCFLTSFSNKKIFFALLGQITYFYIRVGQHVHLTPPKCFLKAYSTHCPQNAPQIWNIFWWTWHTVLFLSRTCHDTQCSVCPSGVTFKKWAVIYCL